MNILIESYIKKFRDSGVNTDEFVGCNDDDVAILTQCQCVEYLPPLYVGFMKRFGRNINEIFNHEWEMDFGVTINLKQFAIDDFKDSSDVIIPDDAFVFAQITQGIGVYYYFTTSDQDVNPSVYRMVSDGGEVKQLYASLTEFYDVFIQSICERPQ